MSVAESTIAASDSCYREQKKILIVEDDPDIAALLELHLSEVYRQIEVCSDGEQGLHQAMTKRFDCVLLDIRLPSMDGLEVCRRLRTANNLVPIMMLTSKSTELDHVLGLELGADDYVTKPFSMNTLISRVKALLRRSQISEQTVGTMNHENSVLRVQDIELNSATREVLVAGKVIDLTVKEFALLRFFMEHPTEVFSRADLLDQIWGYGHEGYEHTVNSHINRLRNKIEQEPTSPRHLVTVWGVGYKLQST